MEEVKKSVSIASRTGVIYRESYRLRGMLHRPFTEGPAYVTRDPATGVVLEERYCWMGGYHRTDGPAHIKRDLATSVVTVESYSIDRRAHRVGGPAYIERDAAGNVTVESYFHQGWCHREPAEGPAVISRGSETNPQIVTLEKYYLFGKWYRHPDDGPWLIRRDPATGDVVEVEYCKLTEVKRRPVLRGFRRREVGGPAPL